MIGFVGLVFSTSPKLAPRSNISQAFAKGTYRYSLHIFHQDDRLCVSFREYCPIGVLLRLRIASELKSLQMRNSQRIQKPSRRTKAPKQPKRARQHHSKKITYQGIEFDSQTGFVFYRHLKNDPAVKEIKLQPVYQIIESYKVTCKRCSGSGKRTSPKTSKAINCSLCHGKRTRVKAGAVYTADFKVTYINGFIEVIDIRRQAF